MAIPAEIHWVLSGTPIQNTVDDLFALFRFLRFSPWNSVSPFPLFDIATCVGHSVVARFEEEGIEAVGDAQRHTHQHGNQHDDRLTATSRLNLNFNLNPVPAEFGHVATNVPIARLPRKSHHFTSEQNRDDLRTFLFPHGAQVLRRAATTHTDGFPGLFDAGSGETPICDDFVPSFGSASGVRSPVFASAPCETRVETPERGGVTASINGGNDWSDLRSGVPRGKPGDAVCGKCDETVTGRRGAVSVSCIHMVEIVTRFAEMSWDCTRFSLRVFMHFVRIVFRIWFIKVE